MLLLTDGAFKLYVASKAQVGEGVACGAIWELASGLVREDDAETVYLTRDDISVRRAKEDQGSEMYNRRTN